MFRILVRLGRDLQKEFKFRVQFIMTNLSLSLHTARGLQEVVFITYFALGQNLFAALKMHLKHSKKGYVTTCLT